MTAQEQKTLLTKEIQSKIKPLKIPTEVRPFIDQFLKECNVHKLQNLIINITDLKNFIQQAIKQYS